MSRKANPTLIGGFVVVAVALLLGMLVLFGGADLWREKLRAVLYFEGSVRGLNVGSAVMFRGVQVGRVVGVRLLMDIESVQALIPVEVEFTPGTIQPVREVTEEYDPEEALATLVEQGLKGRLETQSLLTGLLLVELDLLPDEPVHLSGMGSEGLIEIPTLPTVLQELGQKLASLDVEALGRDVREILDGVSALVSSPELQQAVRELPGAIEHYDALARQLQSTAAELTTLLRDTGGLVRKAEERVDPVFDGVDTLLAELRGAVTAARAAVEDVEQRLQGEGGLLRDLEGAVEATGGAAASAESLLGEGSYLVRELQTSLRELGLAARALRQLAQLLEQRPEALLRGK